MKIVWFRRDLRLQDNAALAAAVAAGEPILPVYVQDDAGESPWPPGAASRWWLQRSLTALDRSLRERGLRLTVRRGGAARELVRLARETGAAGVYWNRRYEPAARRQEQAVAAELAAGGLEGRGFAGALLFEPETVANRAGQPFQVFSPFWRHCLQLTVPEPLRLRAGPLAAPRRWPESLTVAGLALLPRAAWGEKFAPLWEPGEAGGQRRLQAFARGGLAAYASRRDQPAEAGTSRLSPALHFGEVSPRQVWAAVRRRSGASGVFPAGKGEAVFLTELGWREFGHHLLFHFPATPESPLRPKFARFPWAADPGGRKLASWQRGRTGYPIVDAGMRELWATGWMHNRVRMIVASFLVKHLRLPWAAGAAWFWDTLLDADLANNTLGWQWTAGCGADASPYFRIFAPVLQGRKFDGSGAYVRRWVPELARLPDRHLQAPWEAPPEILAAAGVRLGESYPRPMVDHVAARNEALAAFRTLTA